MEYNVYSSGRVFACPNPAHPTPQSTAETDMNTRGPNLSMNQPESGIIQVSNAMKRVNPHCTWDNFQPVAPIIGFTKSAHAYWRFAIIIIATTAAINRTQRFILARSFQDTIARIRRSEARRV